MKRRDFISKSALAGALVPASTLNTHIDQTESKSQDSKRYQNGKSPWPICLDTFTIRPAGSIDKKVEIAHSAGFDAIEPWDNELAEFEKNGGNLSQLGREIKQSGMFVPSMIGLWGCIPENESLFEQSLKETRNRMRMAAEIGCEFAQAIPNKIGEKYDVKFAAKAYSRLLDIGINEYGIKPAIVFVKMFPLKTLGQAVQVALDANHEEARVIPDIFHMYISEGGFEGIKKLNGDLFPIFQFNDAPGGMEISDMQDKHRVFPGDGILPLTDILKDLKATGFSRCVSLELYNPEYHKRDLNEVAKEGLQKTVKVIEESGV